MDSRCALWQNDTSNDALVLETLALLWPFEEWDFQYEILCAVLGPPQKLVQIAIPTDAEAVVPTSEQWVPWLDVQLRFFGTSNELGGRHVSNVIGEVCIHTTCHKRKLELL